MVSPIMDDVNRFLSETCGWRAEQDRWMDGPVPPKYEDPEFNGALEYRRVTD